MIKYKLGCDNLKTRIFISSKTNINYVRHDSSIEVLNDKISFHPYEEYMDYVDMKDYDFYIRCKNDLTANPCFGTIPYSDLILRINKAKDDKVDVIVFLINEDEIELIKTVEDVIDEKIDIDIKLIKTKLLLYPFDYALLEANETFKKDGNIEEFEKNIKYYEDRFKIYFFSPEKDVLPTISKIEYDDDLLEIRKGTLYDCNKNGVILLKRYKNKYPFDYLVKAIKKEIEDIEIIPFILFTDIYSKYVDKLEREIKSVNKVTVIKEGLPAYYGNLYGINSIAVGFIIK